MLTLNLKKSAALMSLAILFSLSIFSFHSSAGIPQDRRSTADEIFNSMTRGMFSSAADNPNIVEVAEQNGSFTILVAALEAADLRGALEGPGPFTVFAPTDDAFKKLPPQLLRDLLKPENKALLTDILTFHVLARDVMADKVAGLGLAKTLNGQFLEIKSRGALVQIENSRVVLPNVTASNGVIHVIDTVLIPKAAPGPNIIQVAQGANRFNTLITALRAASLVSTLGNSGPFTVFAPTDAAFAKIPPRTLNDLLQPQNIGTLTDILTYHVSARYLMAADVVNEDSIRMLNGKAVKISIRNGEVYVNNAKIIRTDIVAENGVIHVLDTVLLP